MESLQLAFLTLGVGAIIGAAFAVLVLVALRARDTAKVNTSSALPDGTRAVLQGMDEVAVVVDASLTVVAASAPASLFGMVEGETLVGDELRALVRSARTTERPEAETLQLRRGVELRSVAARASSIAPRLILLVIRDITERERVEEMRRDFVANTSHELKTPVGAITLLAEAIESAADDPQQVRHFARRMTAEAGRLGQLTSRIMNLSRLQAADDPTSLRDVSVDEVIAAAVETQVVAAEAAQIEILRGGDRGAYVHGDVQVLTEAIANLVANAVAYSPPGSQVGVGVRLVDDVVEIAVTDRGIGIAEGDVARVFERFYRADQARSRRTGGTGLGLSIVKHAVQRHGGAVEVWSRPGKGSTFTVRLPAVGAPDLTLAPKKKRGKKASKKKVGQVVRAPQPVAPVGTGAAAHQAKHGQPAKTAQAGKTAQPRKTPPAGKTAQPGKAAQAGTAAEAGKAAQAGKAAEAGTAAQAGKAVRATGGGKAGQAGKAVRATGGGKAGQAAKAAAASTASQRAKTADSIQRTQNRNQSPNQSHHTDARTAAEDTSGRDLAQTKGERP